MSSIKPYKIAVPEARISDLRDRLGRTVWPSVVEGNDYGGPPLEGMRQLVAKARVFDWRRKEVELNKLSHFTAAIDGQTIHFIHARSGRDDARPLMLIHGWPGSVIEFLHMIEPLTNPEGDHPAFDVVIPSLPGFGFSGPTKDAWNHGRMGRALIELMDELGYPRFAIQGGDAGAIIGPEMGRMAPDKISALHLNAATMGFIPMGPVDEQELATFTPAEKKRLEVLQDFMRVKFGFNLVHSNQPQLVAYAISDSPAGLMSWISQLMDVSEVGEERFITNFMIYWFTGTAASSIRMYYDAAHDPGAWAPKKNSGVPTAVAVFQDGDIAIRRYGESSNNIVRWTEYPHGGHYAVMAAPDDWLKDVREFFAERRKRP